MVRYLIFVVALAVAAPAFAQEVVRGDAVAGLVSKTGKAEIHLITDPTLNEKRLVLKVIVLNLSGAPQSLGPDAVTVMAGETPVVLASRDSLIAALSGSNTNSDETSSAHSAAALPVTGTGQTDVTSFTGGMNSGAGGIPNAALDRTQRRPNVQAAAQLDQVLLKPMTIRPNGADGGQVLTEKLKKRPSEVTVSVAFAGETHRFAVKVPR